MLVFKEHFANVSWHQNIQGSSIVVPGQLDLTIQVTGSVLNKVIFCLDGCDKVIDVFFSNIFNSLTAKSVLVGEKLVATYSISK